MTHTWRQPAPAGRAQARCHPLSAWRVLPILCAALVTGVACQQDVEPWASAALVGVNPQVEATLEDRVLTMPVGTLVPLNINVYSYGAAAENNTEYKEAQEGGLPIVSTNDEVAIGAHHEDGVYAIVGVGIGEAELRLTTHEGDMIETWLVRVVAQAE